VFVGGELSEDATTRYLEILEAGNFEIVSDDADSISRLLGVSVVLLQVVEDVDGKEIIRFTFVHRGNAAMKRDPRTGKIIELFYMSGNCGPSGGRLCHCWTPTSVIDLEMDEGHLKFITETSHSFGMVPAVPLWDTGEPRYGTWPKKVWQSLIAMNERINLFHTEVGFNCSFQAFSAFFTNGKVPEGTILGPDVAVELGETATGNGIFAEYKSPDINLEKFQKWVDQYKSGVADRLKPARNFEINLYDTVLAISEAIDLGLPQGSKIKVEFKLPSLPVNEKEKHDIRKEKLALGVITIEDFWRDENPDITPEEIAVRKQRIEDSQGVVPGFGNIVSEA
jgi:hypothetical protein